MQMIRDTGFALAPVDWGHVRAALTAMERFDTVIRPCSLSASCVYLSAHSKMSTAFLEAVANFKVVNFMRALHKEDANISDPANKVFKSDPRGTIAYLAALSELVTYCRFTRGRYAYRTASDVRLQHADELIGQFRVNTQIIHEMWPKREEFMVRHTIQEIQTFISPQCLHALDVMVKSFRGYLAQILTVCPSLRETGVRWLTTGKYVACTVTLTLDPSAIIVLTSSSARVNVVPDDVEYHFSTLRSKSQNTNPTANEVLTTQALASRASVAKSVNGRIMQARKGNVGASAFADDQRRVADTVGQMTCGEEHEAASVSLHRHKSEPRVHWDPHLALKGDGMDIERGEDLAAAEGEAAAEEVGEEEEEEEEEEAQIQLARIVIAKQSAYFAEMEMTAHLERMKSNEDQCRGFVEAVCSAFLDEADLYRERGGGVLAYGGKAWNQRLTAAYRVLFAKVASWEARSKLWATAGDAGRFLTRGMINRADNIDSTLSLFLAREAMDTAVEHAMVEAHQCGKDTTAVKVFDDALQTAVQATNKRVFCNAVVYAHLQYLTGYIVGQTTSELQGKEHETSRRFVHWMDTSVGACMERVGLVSTQRLVRPQPVLVQFTQRFEALLQREYLNPKIALELGGSLFRVTLEKLAKDARVRDLWSFVQRQCNVQLKEAGVQSKQHIDDVASVDVLERFVRHYLHSKQRTWRLGRGLAAMSVNACALRAQLKVQRQHAHTAYKRGVEKNLHLGNGAIDMLYDCLAAVSKEEGQKLVQRATSDGAVLASRAVRDRDAVVVDSESGVGAGAGAGHEVAGSMAVAGDEGDGSAGTASTAGAEQKEGDSLPAGAFFVLLYNRDHNLAFEAVDDATIIEPRQRDRPLRVTSVTGCKSLAVIGGCLQVGDFVIKVEKKSTGREYRRVEMTAPCNDGSTGGKYPLRLTVVPPQSALAQGLPAVARQLIGSAEEVSAATAAAEVARKRAATPSKTPSKKRGDGESAPDTDPKSKQAKAGELKRARGQAVAVAAVNSQHGTGTSNKRQRNVRFEEE